MQIILTSFTDAVKTELREKWGTRIIGWFADEPDALAAAGEHIMLRSAIMPELRKLGGFEVVVEQRITATGRVILPFARATLSRAGGCGRRLVLRPNGSCKEWVPIGRTD